MCRAVLTQQGRCTKNNRHRPENIFKEMILKMKKTYFKKSISLIMTVLMIMSCWVFVAPEKAEAKATIDTYRKADKYGTPYWDGSDVYYSTWNSGSSYTTFKWPKHIYLDMSETLESAGYYYTVEWDYGNGTNYRIVNNGFIFGGWRLNSTGYPTNYYTMNNMFSNYDLDASTHGTQYNGSGTDFDLRVGGDNWDNAEVIIWRNPNNDNAAQHQYVFLKGTPNAVGTGRYSTSGDKPTSFGGWQYYNKGWKNASDKYTASNDSSNWTTDCYEGTWKEVAFDITIYDKADLNYAKQKSDTIYNNNAQYADFITAGLDNYVAQHDATAALLKTRVTTQDALTAQVTALGNAANALRFAASNSNLLQAISSANSIKNASDYSAKYTYATRKAFEEALINATTNTSYDEGVTTYAINFSDNSTWNAGEKANTDQNNINNLTNALNSAMTALTGRTYDVSYENLFSFSSWVNSASGVIGTSAKGTMTYDVNAGTITFVNNASNTQSNPNDHYSSYGFANNHYNVNLTPGEEYFFQYTTSGGTGDQVHIFFYDDNGNAVENKANNYSPFANAYGTGNGTSTIYFAAPEGATKAAFRFGTTVLGETVTFSDMMLYTKSRGDAVSIADWTTRPIRKVYTYGEAMGTLDVPVRPGYTFDCWYVDYNGDGLCDSGEEVTADLSSFAITQDWVLNSNWTINQYTVKFVDANGDIVSETEYDYGTTPIAPANTAAFNDADGHHTFAWPTIEVVTGDVTYKEAESIGEHTTETKEENRVEATCAKDGSYVLVTYCSVCDTEISRENKTITATGAHTWTEATCTAPKTCSVCGATEGEALNHDFSLVVSSTAGDCQTVGTTTYKCSRCDATNVVNGALGEHNYTSVVTNPTCTEDGYTTYTCSICGDTYTDDKVDALGHTPGTAVKENEKEATCTAEGSYVEVVYCSVCNEKLSSNTVTVPKKDHQWSWAQYNNGTTHRRTCSVCSAYEEGYHSYTTDPQPVTMSGSTAHYHNYKCTLCEARGVMNGSTPMQNIGTACYQGSEATYTDNGDGNHTADCVCGNTKTEAHWWSVTDSKDATCTENGYKNSKCNYCSATKEETIPATHTLGEWAEEVPATCVKEGTKGHYTCSVCGKHFDADGNEISDLTIAINDNHANKEDKAKQEPTCTEVGYEAGVYCNDCQTWVSGHEEIEAKGHSEAEAVKEKIIKASCVADGSYEDVVYCSVCSTELSREAKVITKREHKFTDWVEIKEPTYTEKGEEKHTCTNAEDALYEACSYEETREVDMLVDNTAPTGTITYETTVWDKFLETITFGIYVSDDVQLTITAEDAESGIAKIEYYITDIAMTEDDVKAIDTWSEYTDSVTIAKAAAAQKVVYAKLTNTQGGTAYLSTDGFTFDTVYPVISTESDCTTAIITVTEINLDKVTVNDTEIALDENGTYTISGVGTYKVVATDKAGNTAEISVEIKGHTPAEAVRENEVAATCYAEGSYDEVVYCSVAECKHEISREEKTIEKIAHTPGAAVEENRKEATCYAEGSYDEVVYCSVAECKHEISREEKTIEKIAHTPGAAVEENREEATCYKEGSYDEVVYCSVEECKEKLSSTPKTIEKIAHTPGAAVEENREEATCYAEGSYDEVVYCSVAECKHEISREEKTIEKIAHTPGAAVEENREEATCTVDGSYESVVYCSVAECKAQISRDTIVLPAPGHSYTSEVTAPTCETDGFTTHTCSACGNSYVTDTVTALGHAYDETRTEDKLTRPTQKADGTWTKGYYTFVCANDNTHTKTVDVERATYTDYETAVKNLNELLATDIKEEAKNAINDALAENTLAEKLIESEQQTVDNATAALTEVFNNYKGSLNTYTVTFIVDGKTVKTETVISGKDAVAPTVVEKASDAENHYTFTVWDNAYTNVTEDITVTAQFSSEAHTFSTHADKDDKYHTDECSCGYKKDVQHSYDGGVVTTPATCEGKGVKTYTCSVCGGTKTGEIKELGHEYESKITTPTCTEQGYTTYTCKVCGSAYDSDFVDELGHSFTKYVSDGNSTCIADGTKTAKCDRCDVTDTIKGEKDANNHVALAQVTAKAPTCTEIGWDAYEECSACGYTTYVEKESLGHDYKAEVTAPTCTEQGYTTHTCSRCGDSYVDSYVDEKGHSYDDGVVTTEPTCTTEGVKTFTCSACGDTYTEKVAKLGHNEVEHEAKAPTCTEIGWDAYVTCTRCDYTTYVEKESLGHDYKAEVTAPTCTEQGYTTHTCSRCGDSYVDSYVDEKGHSYDDGVVTTEPTCTTEGVKTFTCSACGDTYTEKVAKLGHNEVEHEAKAPTCTEIGWDAYVTCTRCDYTTYVEKESLGHDYKAEVTAPTCTEKGYTTHTCSRCGDSYVDSYVDEKGHSYDDGVVTTDPTCTTEGVKTFTCSACGDTYTEKVDATGHTEEAIPAVDATCEDTGLTAGVKCSVCGEILTAQETVPALGHKWDAATCTTPKTCLVCGKTEGTVGGHTIVTQASKAPTCEEGGFSEGSYCSVCGEIFSAQIEFPATGHIKATRKENIDPATCQKEGYYDLVTYCETCGKVLSTEGKTIGKTEHAAGSEEIIEEVKATCKAEGYRIGVTSCSVCDEEISRRTIVLPKLKHSPIETPAVKPTCETTGLTEGTHCEICGTVLTAQKVIPATGHTKETITATIEAATCTKEGVSEITVFCTVCDKTLSVERKPIPMAEHTPADEIREDETPATCGKNGKYTSVINCSVCGAEISRRVVVIPSSGEHDFTIDKGRVEPTCTENGYIAYACTCGAQQKTVLYATGHIDKNGDLVCDDCGAKFDNDCGCLCHKDHWFIRFIYKIVRFFWKLFRVHKECYCTSVHY